MTSKITNKFSPEVRARAVRMVLEHAPEAWAAVPEVACVLDIPPRHQELERQALECTVGQGRAGSPRAGVVMRFRAHEGTGLSDYSVLEGRQRIGRICA
jgi:hypothetical protein